MGYTFIRVIALLGIFIVLGIYSCTTTPVISSIDEYYYNKPVSSSMSRYLTQWEQTQPQQNEFFSSFSYEPLKGIPYEVGISRRDPSTIIYVDSCYYVFYTRSPETAAPAGYANATRERPATTWDMCSIYYAISNDGTTWSNHQALSRSNYSSIDCYCSSLC